MLTKWPETSRLLAMFLIFGVLLAILLLWPPSFWFILGFFLGFLLVDAVCRDRRRRNRHGDQ